jgi:putative selenate reductase
MDKPFRPIPLARLARWIFDSLDRHDTVLGIPKGNFQVPDPRFAAPFQGRPLAAPLGMAAGPHTQLSQNLVAGWLCGARFMELKTVQILDELEVSRPCIDAADETYNCEWSQELKLEQSFHEYLNAWVLIHALAHRFGLPDPGTHFAMSVGYNLEGIRHPRVQAFIAAMRGAGPALDAAVAEVASVYPGIRDIAVPDRLSNHITLSTMHGCPPAEIERIARHLITEVGVHTWVKLNPTLLGPERLRDMLNHTLGFDIEVPDLAFEHDPRFPDAMAMVKSLAALAKDRPQEFGLKLSNTLEVVNHRGVFPAGEKMMYLSGRALHPLTLKLAQLVDAELGGTVPLSFCGGADAQNFVDLVADGLSPVTVCTDLLKPGGYARLQQYLVNLSGAFDHLGASSLPDFLAAASGGRGAADTLARHADSAPRDARYHRRARPMDFKGPRALGAFDCIAAPCQEACPAHQNIPDYLWHVAQGAPGAALEVILHTNPQPGVTGSVCDHPCTEKCVRNFYDGPLAIREIKRFAFEQGEVPTPGRGPDLKVSVGIVGAGPAGLSAAYYLARMGFDAQIFESRDSLGGMVGSVIPAYRLDGKALGNDLDRLEHLGVTIHRGITLGRNLSLADLRGRFGYVFLGVGAARGKRLGIPGEDAVGMVDALDFLDAVQAKAPGSLGTRVLVIGGGNTAMDAARSARRLTPEGEVTLVYRRTRAEMPADPAEVQDCIEEGIGLRNLLAPARVVVAEGKVVGLACTPMRLGARDASGRPRPEPSGEPEVILPADTIIPAISQEPELDFLEGLSLERHRDGTLLVSEEGETSQPGLFAGGDAVRGPASVIHAIADGRRVAEAIGRRHGVALPVEPELDKGLSAPGLMAKKAETRSPLTVPMLPLQARGGFDEVLQSLSPEAAAREAERCLDCDDLCSLCVTVCPNRANLAYATPTVDARLPFLVVRDGKLQPEGDRPFRIAQTVQILNLGDACNDCGNCTPFCPTRGAPYLDKPRFWVDGEAFEESARDAYRLVREGEVLVLEARLGGRRHRLARSTAGLEYRTPEFRARVEPETLRLLDWEALAPLDEGSSFDLQPLGVMAALLHAESVLPV